MRKQRYKRIVLLCTALVGITGLTGCGTVGGAAADLGLAGAGGVAGYQVSGQKIGGAAAGAAVGYLAAKVTQSEVQKKLSDAEQRGFDRALNQAVKQQYWIIQEQQRSWEKTDEHDSRLVPVVLPETKINGVGHTAHVEFLRVEP